MMVVDGEALLIQIRERLLHIKGRLTDIETRRQTIGAHVVELMTLREFTEEQLNDKSPDAQETISPSPRAAAEKYSTR
jgi:hypothetical protein